MLMCVMSILLLVSLLSGGCIVCMGAFSRSWEGGVVVLIFGLDLEALMYSSMLVSVTVVIGKESWICEKSSSRKSYESVGWAPFVAILRDDASRQALTVGLNKLWSQ